MPHNPRRSRVPQAPDVVITKASIAEALGRAVALRRRTACDPNDVSSLAMTPGEVHRSPKQHRAPMPWDIPEEPDPWFLVGWVCHQRKWEFPGAQWFDRYDQSWAVWLNVEDGRIWLKWSRWRQGAKDDPYP